MRIQSIRALQIFDSRGDPTVEAVVTLENGVSGRGLVPAGASKGRHEARELRDGDPLRFRGRSVYRAVANIESALAPALIGFDPVDQEAIDQRMIDVDGTPDKSRLGANAILAVSMATARAAATARGRPLFAHLAAGGGTLLPLPEIQIFGGGKHAPGSLDVQDFMIVALQPRSFEETLEIAFNVYRAAGDILRERGHTVGVADEGGHWPRFDSNEAALETLVTAVERAGYQPGADVGLSLDIAATDLFQDGVYELRRENQRYTSGAFAELMADWVARYPIVSLEDPMAEDDWAGWRNVSRLLGGRCQLIGDDHFTTSIARIERGVAERTANAVLIKLNQIGTVTETLHAIRRTQQAGWLPVVSARSGETEDAFISHLAVASDAGQLKVGSFARSERLAKWNEILRIERELGARARFVGAGLFAQAGIRLGSPPSPSRS